MLTSKAKEAIRKIINQKAPAVVISHVNPDGDAIGSSLALAIFLQKLEVPVTVIIPNEVPDFLKWLPGYNLVITQKDDQEKCRSKIAGAKTIFLLDFNDSSRIGDLYDEVHNSRAFRILIDHHQRPELEADIMISEAWRGSAGEMVYLLMQDLDLLKYMDKDIATCLYVAIMTDTGNFRYGSSYAEIFNIVGFLVGQGIDKDHIYTSVYDSYSEARMKLMGYCMSEKMVVLPELHAAYISITREELKRFNHQVGDTEGFVNIPFSVKGVKVTALFIEKRNHVKISFRSKGKFSVDKLASEHFDGGGHVNAAGGESKLSLEETVKKFEGIIKEQRDELT